MSSKAEKDQTAKEEMLSADAEIARLVDVISTQFKGDIVSYFESLARLRAEDEGELDEKETVQSFLRSYR